MLLMAPMMNVYTHDWTMLRETLPVIVQVRYVKLYIQHGKSQDRYSVWI